MSTIVQMIKENSPASYFIIAVVVLIALGSLSSFVNPEGIQESYVRNGQPKKTGIVSTILKATKVSDEFKRKVRVQNSFSEGYFYKSKLLEYFKAQSVEDVLSAFDNRKFKSMGQVKSDQVSQEAYLSLTPHFLKITISTTGNGKTISATRQASELPLDQLKKLSSKVEKVTDGVIYHLIGGTVSGKRYSHTAKETKMFGGHQLSWTIAEKPS